VSEAEVREKLLREVDVAAWSDLRTHAFADRLFLVATESELIDVAVAVALDQASEVKAWIEAGRLARPTPEQIEQFESTDRTSLRTLIVAPYVLSQEITTKVDQAAKD
jgi:hypothetical protein